MFRTEVTHATEPQPETVHGIIPPVVQQTLLSRTQRVNQCINSHVAETAIATLTLIGISTGALAVKAVTDYFGSQIAAPVTDNQYPSGALPSDHVDLATPANNARANTPVQVAPGVDLIEPTLPVKAEFIPVEGKSYTIRIRSTSLKDVVHNRELTPTIDPPLVYCPGTKPVNVKHKYRIGKNTVDCQAMYAVTDFGKLTTDVRQANDYAPFITGHASVLGYKLPGNKVPEIKGGSRLIVTTEEGDIFTFRARAQHYYPQRGTNQLQTLLDDHKMIPPVGTALVEACDPTPQHRNAANVVIYDLIAAKAA